MARRSYTEQERREVLADVPTLGVKAAASKWDRDYFESLGLIRLRGTVKFPERAFWEIA